MQPENSRYSFWTYTADTQASKPQKMTQITGKVAQIIGPVIDVEFDSGVEIPKIYDSLEVKREDGSTLVLEVQSHIGENTVRTISMDSTDGLSRGTAVNVTGNAIGSVIANVATYW